MAVDGAAEDFERGIEPPLAPPVALVVRFCGHVPHQLVDVVVIAKEGDALLKRLGTEHQPLRVAVEQLQVPQRCSSVGGNDTRRASADFGRAYRSRRS